MSDIEKKRAEISAIIGDIEVSQQNLGPLGDVEFDDIAEPIEIIARIEARLNKARAA